MSLNFCLERAVPAANGARGLPRRLLSGGIAEVVLGAG